MLERGHHGSTPEERAVSEHPRVTPSPAGSDTHALQESSPLSAQQEGLGRGFDNSRTEDLRF